MNEIRANQTDNQAPHAYLGRISYVDTDTWLASTTNWDTTATDEGPHSDHQPLNLFTGADAEQRAEQAIRDRFETWKTQQ